MNANTSALMLGSLIFAVFSPQLAAQSSFWISDTGEQTIQLAQAQAPLLPNASDGLSNELPASTGGGWLRNQFLSATKAVVIVASPPFVGDVSSALLHGARDAATVFQIPSVDSGMRSINNTDNRVRGRKLGQTPGRGSYWFPARQDLDTLYSKIDSRIVDRVTVVKGPYSALYGPGLSFFDVQLLSTPRHDDGFRSNGSTSMELETNGERWHGRQAFWGGSEDWGYRVGYGHRGGSDYETGAGVELPSSYKSRMVDLALGGNLTGEDNIEIHVLRLDQTDVEFPGQWFDINFLVTDAYDFKYTRDGHRHYDELSIESWYNRTRFEGDNFRPSKNRALGGDPAIIPSETDVDAMSVGYNVSVRWQDTAIGDVKAGSDFRYLKQRLNEDATLVGGIFDIPVGGEIPRSHSSNPGLFVEATTRLSDDLELRSGARADWVSANGENPDAIDVSDQHFDLWSAFAVLTAKMTDHWTLDVAGGHAMRPPTMTELYAMSPFIAALPQFRGTSILGNTELLAERMWQLDVGTRHTTEFVNCGVNGFYSWINDYITFDTIGDGPLFAYVNTDLATLAGFDAFADVQLTRSLTAFGTLSYVEGRDRARSGNPSPFRQKSSPASMIGSTGLRSNSAVEREPLPALPPLQSRFGFAIHEALDQPKWSVEFAVTLSTDQDRIASTLLEESTESFAVFDIRGYARLFENLTATAAVLNVTDENYRTYFDARRNFQSDVDISQPVFQPGLNVFVGAELTY